MAPRDYSHILNQLDRLRAERPDVFGACAHSFQLNPPLSEAAVNEFEQLYDIALPDDFREFITILGNGGAGPYYGVFPLGLMDSGFSLGEWHENDGFVGDLSEAFPFREEWNDLSAVPPLELADHDEAEYERRQVEFEKSYWNPTLLNGSFPICDQGCALRVLLVVTGSEAGFLWEDRRAEQGGLRPLRLADGSQATFIRWYEAWLEDCLRHSSSIKS